MNDVFLVPTAIATGVSYVGFIGWLIAFSLSWGLLIEGLFLGLACGGIICGAFIGFAEPHKVEGEDKP